MNEIRDTAYAHLQRDMQAGRKWRCVCDACREMRSLVGIDKLLHVRPLVREIEQLEEQMTVMPEGPQLEACKQRYLEVYDELARTMAQ